MKFKTLTVAALMTVAASAQAAIIQSSTATFAGTVVDFNNFDGYILPQVGGTGLITDLDLGNGITFTTTPFATVGQNAQDLGANGLWGARGTPDSELIATPTGDGNFLASGFTKNRGEFGFSFDAPVMMVGAFFNQYQATDTTNNQLELLAYDIDGNVLESYKYRIDTAGDSYNEGTFLAISRGSADIYGFGVADGSFVMDNLTVSAVPEPEAFAMLLAGLVAVGAAARRRRA